MSPNTPTRRSPRTPRQQTTDQYPHSQHQLVRSMLNNSRHTSISSVKQTMDAQSRAGSMSNIRRSSRTASRQASTSGGVLGLPGASTSLNNLDEILLDPSLWDPNLESFHEFISQGAFDLNDLDATHTSTNNYDANQSQNADFQQFFDQNPQFGLGIDFLPTKDGQQGQLGVPYTHQTEADQDHSNLAPVNSTLNPAFDSTNNYQNFDPWASYSMPLDTTPGFSAIPGGNSFSSQLPDVYQQQPMYPDPHNGMYSTGPYFNPTVQQNTGYIQVPIDPQFQQFQSNAVEQGHNAGRDQFHRSSHENDNATVQPKRKRTQPDSDSDEDVPIVKRYRQAQPVKHRASPQSDNSRRDSAVSDGSSLGKRIHVAVVRAGEKPKKCDDKSWVRINNTTKGETTRTARINQFTEEGTKYKVKPLPIGDWETAKFRFEYTHHYGMDEFKKRTMSARQINEYITQYPGEHLRIWIQITPGDSARRYASKSHSECLFEHCPNRTWAKKGTIEVGSYRVAFDEKHKKYGKGVVDPFDCVGYAHLYCMERFLDFPAICEVADVQVDTRANMTKEPKGVAAFTFSNKHVVEQPLAEKFIKAAKSGGLGRTPEFCNYPVHSDYAKGERKPHKHTLVFALYKVNLDHRTRSQLKQFVNRDIKPGAFPIHQGDQEVKMVDEKVETLAVFKKAKEAKQLHSFDKSAYYDQFHPEINRRITACRHLRAKFEAEDKAGTAPTRGGSKKRKITTVDDSDDEPEFGCNDDDDFEEIGDEYDQQQHVGTTRGSRSSPRKKERIDYTEPQDIYAQLPRYPAPYDASNPHPEGLYVQPAQFGSNETYGGSDPSKPRQTSCSNLFPQTRYDIDEQSVDLDNVPLITEENLEKLLSLSRRKSSTMSIGPYSSIMKSPKLLQSPRSPQTICAYTRTASFNAQPVTSSKEYNVNDPPSQVAVPSNVTRDHHEQGRRSTRLASKTTQSLDKRCK